MHSSLRRSLINVAVIVVALIAALVAVEIGLRLFRPQKHFAAIVNVWDREMGTRHRPGARGFVSCEAYEIDLIINSKGLRDREFAYAKPEATRRVLCLGGSFTAGYGVRAEETYPKVLERLLNSDQDGSVTWEVLNGGVGSTGTSHHLAFFKTEGYKYNPDIVMLSFSQTTDYWDSMTSGLYTVEEGKLVKHDAPRTRSRIVQQVVRWIPFYNTLFARSHLLNFVKGRVARYHFRDLAERIELPEKEAEIEAVEHELIRHLLIALRDAVAEQGGRLVMTGIPYPETWEWYPETIELIAYMETEGVPFIDLAPALRSGAERGLGIHIPGDRHWTATGHELAGRALYDNLVGRILTDEHAVVTP
jgi:hypothetical protein